MLRNLLTAVVFLAALGVSAAATVEVVRQGLRGPVQVVVDGVPISGSEATTGVLHVLLAYEFEPNGDRYQKRVVLDLIEDRLDRGENIVAQWNALALAQRRRVQQNLSALAPVWLHERTQEFHRVPRHFRERYLDEQIDQIWGWAAAATQRPGEPPVDLQGFNLYEVQAEMQDWLERLDADERRQHVQFWQALQARLAQRGDPWQQLQGRRPAANSPIGPRDPAPRKSW